MTLSHDCAAILEIHVLNAWNVFERGYLHGAIDCDKFMGDPYHAVDLLLAPYAFRHPETNNDMRIRVYTEKLSGYCSREFQSKEFEKAFLDLFIELSDYLKENYS